MPKDKFSAVWVSHSSLSDFLACPRAYYLKNVYKDPKTKHKIQVITPPLSLGAAVHEVVESLSVLPTHQRFLAPLVDKFEYVWQKYTGKKGGFFDNNTEHKYKERGIQMLRNIEKNPGPLTRLAVKINMDLPYYWLSDDDNIILCGKIDWLEYLPDTDSVHIIDFKTSKTEEDPSSLQLPIYHLLVNNTQNRPATEASYWYLGLSDSLTQKTLPNLEEAQQKILKIAKEIKLARQLERFRCPTQGCHHCRPLEAVLEGRGEYVGVSGYNNDLYVVNKDVNSKESQLL